MYFRQRFGVLVASNKCNNITKFRLDSATMSTFGTEDSPEASCAACRTILQRLQVQVLAIISSRIPFYLHVSFHPQGTSTTRMGRTRVPGTVQAQHKPVKLTHKRKGFVPGLQVHDE